MNLHKYVSAIILTMSTVASNVNAADHKGKVSTQTYRLIYSVMNEYSNLHFTHEEYVGSLSKELAEKGYISQPPVDFDSADEEADESDWDSEEMERDYQPMRDIDREFVLSINWQSLDWRLKKQNMQKRVTINTKTLVARGYIPEENSKDALNVLVNNNWGASCECKIREKGADHTTHKYSYNTVQAWFKIQPAQIEGLLEEEKRNALRKPSFHEFLNQKRKPK